MFAGERKIFEFIKFLECEKFAKHRILPQKRIKEYAAVQISLDFAESAVITQRNASVLLQARRRACLSTNYGFTEPRADRSEESGQEQPKPLN